tara:strand:+ start:195 stop:557 length:363 start_codon:yes stop_codon:yes gene_type:complete
MTDHKHHIIPLKTYLIVFATLLLMTGLTIFSAQYDFGFFNIILALLIAGFKSSLVLLFFMHLYYDNKINLALIIGSVLFVAIFIGLTMIDTNRRKDIYDIKGKVVNEQVIYKSHNEKDSH